MESIKTMLNAAVFAASVLILTACGGGSGSGVPDETGDSGTQEETASPTPNPNITETPAPGGTETPPPTVTVTPTPSPTAYTENPHQERFFGDQDLTVFQELFDHSKLPQIEVDITQEEWDALIAELEVNIRSKVYFRANARITLESGLNEITEVGFRIRGNTTRSIPEFGGEYRLAHFKIKFNETFDLVEDSLDYIDRDERRFANLRALNLKSTSIAHDAPHMRELYAYDLFNQVGVPAPLTNSALLTITIGGVPVNYGVYTIVEPIDKTFLRKRYGDEANEGNLYKCLWQEGGPATLAPIDSSNTDLIGLEVPEEGFKPTYDRKTNKSNTDYSDIVSFTENVTALEGSDFQNYLEENFEVDSFLRFQAMNTLVGMPDDYWAMGNNYYLYFNNMGKIQFIPYDYDHTFGQGWLPVDTGLVDPFTWWRVSWETMPEAFGLRPLSDKIMEIPEYSNLYAEYLDRFALGVDSVFTYQRYEQKFNQIAQNVDPDGDGQTDSDLVDYESQITIEGQDNYFNNRIGSLDTFLNPE